MQDGVISEKREISQVSPMITPFSTWRQLPNPSLWKKSPSRALSFPDLAEMECPANWNLGGTVTREKGATKVCGVIPSNFSQSIDVYMHVIKLHKAKPPLGLMEGWK